LLAAWVVSTVAAPLAAAPATPEQHAVAQALFEEGRRLVADGRHGEGCKKLEASQAIDPAMGTQFHLGDCYQLIGRLASAWAQFLDVAAAARAAGQEARERVARKRAGVLEPRLSRLRVHVEAPARGMVVTRNGVPMTSEQWGLELPVDGGRYRIRATAPGHKTWSSRVALAVEGQRVEVDIPKLSPGIDVPPPDARTVRLRAAIALGAVGASGLAVGAAAGIYATVKKKQADEHCPSANECFQRGLELRDAARPAATVSTVAISVGLGASVGALVLWLTARDTGAPEPAAEARLAPWVAPGTAGVGLTGVW
jgi:hypothetical protein